ncbi:MAG TPA: hypothetical protein PL193_07645 [Xanthobacteraceae bacterium]|nr:hypothetical protein [Xanthobacteraceae bacterium]
MAWTQADIDTLKAAIATGARRVKYADGRETEFRSLDEMERALSKIEAEIGGNSRSMTSYIAHDRG